MPPRHECEKGDQLDRMESKLDKFLEGHIELKGRVDGHEKVAIVLASIAGLIAAFWAIWR